MKPKWTDVLQDPRPIEAVYGSAPTLEKVHVKEVIFNEDGPSVTLRLDLRDFPENPPKKWIQLGYNRVQLRLVCLGLKRVQHRGWSTDNTADILIVPADTSKLRLISTGGTVELDFLFDILLVEKISAYREERE